MSIAALTSKTANTLSLGLAPASAAASDTAISLSTAPSSRTSAAHLQLDGLRQRYRVDLDGVNRELAEVVEAAEQRQASYSQKVKGLEGILADIPGEKGQKIASHLAEMARVRLRCDDLERRLKEELPARRKEEESRINQIEYLTRHMLVAKTLLSLKSGFIASADPAKLKLSIDSYSSRLAALRPQMATGVEQLAAFNLEKELAILDKEFAERQQDLQKSLQKENAQLVECEAGHAQILAEYDQFESEVKAEMQKVQKDFQRQVAESEASLQALKEKEQSIKAQYKKDLARLTEEAEKAEAEKAEEPSSPTSSIMKKIEQIATDKSMFSRQRLFIALMKQAQIPRADQNKMYTTLAADEFDFFDKLPKLTAKISDFLRSRN